MTLTINPFPSDNLEDGARLYQTAFNEPPWDDNWTVDAAQTRLSEIIDTPGYQGYSASLNEELVGLVVGNFEQWYSGKHFYVDEMCTHPNRQRRGVGAELIQHLINEVQSEGAELIYLYTMRETPAREFYDAHGFVIDEQMKQLSIKLEP